MWEEEVESYSQQPNKDYHFRPAQDEPILMQNDFLKMINLQERYNYLKSLIKLQRLHNYDQENNENNMIKVMLQLIQYYAQCISQAEVNIDNIIAYFQQKMRDLNHHYQAVVSRQVGKKAEKEIRVGLSSMELGEIPLLSLQKELKGESTSSMKSSHNASLMVAIQNQNIEEHISNSIRKVDFMKKSIASSIKDQEEALESRLKDKRRKFKEDKYDTPESITTAATIHTHFQSTFKRKKEAFSSFHEIIRNTNFSSDSELDEAESLYISNFNIQQGDAVLQPTK